MTLNDTNDGNGFYKHLSSELISWGVPIIFNIFNSSPVIRNTRKTDDWEGMLVYSKSNMVVFLTLFFILFRASLILFCLFYSKTKSSKRLVQEFESIYTFFISIIKYFRGIEAQITSRLRDFSFFNGISCLVVRDFWFLVGISKDF